MKTWEATTREHARTILTEVLTAVTPQAVIRERVRVADGVLHVDGGPRVDFNAHARVRLAAVGKAAPGMAAQAEAWAKYADALVVTPDDVAVPGFEVMVSDHPVPTARSVAAGERLLGMARATAPDDLLVVLLSGGGSALAEVPAVPLAHAQDAVRRLLKVAAPIHEVNVVRKHLSLLKGGRLAEACRGRLVVLSLSDVAGDDVSAIASGPAAPDPSTFRDAVDVLVKHDLWEPVPASVREHLERGLAGDITDTPKPGSPVFGNVENHVLAGNALAVHRAAAAAERLGYRAVVLEEALKGEARDVGRDLADLARRTGKGEGDVPPPVAFILGGETVVNVRGSGKGGRNQELVLAAVPGLGGERAVLASFGTDGVDGPTDAAGAIADGFTLARARKVGLDVDAHLEENNAYRFFDALQDLVRTGPTGTNVRDVAVLLVGGPSG